jgi:hypothetical protein
MLVVLLGVLALMFTAFAGPVAAKPAKEPPGKSKSTEQSRTVSVMTRNLYLGAELNGILAAFATGNQDAVVAAATDTWKQVRASDPAERMAAVADEIVRTKPHAVGLQEVTKYTSYRFPGPTGDGPPMVVEYELLDLLLDALEDRGATYREVELATADNFTNLPDLPIPVIDPEYNVTEAGGKAQPNRLLGLLDRDVIIVRDGVQVANAQNGQFSDTVMFPLPIKRGWGSADLTVGDATFRFVNSHTEAFGPSAAAAEAMRVKQVNQLLTEQAAITPELPTVYAGDYNSKAPNADAYKALLAGGLHDLWSQARSSAMPASATCCQLADLTNKRSLLDERIDLLLGTEGVRAKNAKRTGDRPVKLPGATRWASDHAGVVSVVVIPE